MKDVKDIEMEIEEGIFGTVELREIKRRYSAKNARTFGIAILAGIVSAGLSGFGTLGVAHYNSVRNPYRDSEVMANYHEMVGTLSELKELREGSPERERYVPEGIQEEDFFSTLDDYIARVEEDIGEARVDPNFKAYAEWKDEHFTVDDYGRLFIQAMGLPALFYFGFTGVGARLVARNNRERDKEIRSLRARLPY